MTDEPDWMHLYREAVVPAEDILANEAGGLDWHSAVIGAVSPTRALGDERIGEAISDHQSASYSFAWIRIREAYAALHGEDVDYESRTEEFLSAVFLAGYNAHLALQLEGTAYVGARPWESASRSVA